MRFSKILKMSDLFYKLATVNIKPMQEVISQPGIDQQLDDLEEEAFSKYQDYYINTSEDIKDDIIHWLPKVKKGGILAGHDYYFPPQPISWGLRPVVNSIDSVELDEYYKSNASSAYCAVRETLGTQNIIADQDCYIYQKK